ncbi:MAG: nucleoside triphosphate pyrophosphohydrolase [Planctomycetes bacterium]|nr:nucleoside triphosphate pyrophosphohydrolase [Planctomycetota bacterium]
MAEQPTRALPGLQRLIETVARLRAPDGCPWDREQTAASMAPHLLEEAYEAADAIRRERVEAVQEELGDVLVNVAMISQIESEGDRFDLEQVAARAAEKLIRRHPHVFGDRKADSAELAYRSWEQQKKQEQAAAGDASPRGALAGVPLALPALLRAFRVGEKAARSGFDWPDRSGPRAKVDEELRELDEAIAGGDQDRVTAELGDVLFSLCNLARHVGANPEVALARTTDEFQRRFSCIEEEFGYELQGRPLAELDAAWNRAKQSRSGNG